MGIRGQNVLLTGGNQKQPLFCFCFLYVHSVDLPTDGRRRSGPAAEQLELRSARAVLKDSSAGRAFVLIYTREWNSYYFILHFVLGGIELIHMTLSHFNSGNENLNGSYASAPRNLVHRFKNNDTAMRERNYRK